MNLQNLINEFKDGELAAIEWRACAVWSDMAPDLFTPELSTTTYLETPNTLPADEVIELVLDANRMTMHCPGEILPVIQRFEAAPYKIRQEFLRTRVFTDEAYGL